MRCLIGLAICALVAFAPGVFAADFALSAGAGATVGVRWTEVAFMDATGDTRSWRGLDWQPTATLGWIGRRDDRKDRLDHSVWIAGAGARLVFWRNAFLGVEIGATSHTTDAVSSHAEFIDSLGWQGDRFVLMLRHISNANLFGGRNLGETMLLAGVRF